MNTSIDPDNVSSPTGRPTSYNLLQQNKHRYAASEMGTRRSNNNHVTLGTQMSRRAPVVGNVHTSRERLSSSNSHSRSPLRSMERPPANRHSNNSVCSQMFASLNQRKESAQKLLHAVELSEQRSKKSVNSLRNKSIDNRSFACNRNSQGQFGATSSEINHLMTAHSTNIRESRTTLTRRFNSSRQNSTSSVNRPLRLRQSGDFQQRHSKERVHRQFSQSSTNVKVPTNSKRCLTASRINGKPGLHYHNRQQRRLPSTKTSVERSTW